MKTLKKCVLFMLVALMLLSLAAPAFAMESRAVVRPCSQCSGGVVTKTESWKYESTGCRKTPLKTFGTEQRGMCARG